MNELKVYTTPRTVPEIYTESSAKQEALYSELREVIDTRMESFDLSYYDVIGTLQLLTHAYGKEAFPDE